MVCRLALSICLGLSLASLNETVEVVAEAVVLDTDNATVKTDPLGVTSCVCSFSSALF